MEVPKNKLRPILRCGFFISPAIKVTLFQASLLKIEPTIEEAIAPTAAAPSKGIIIACQPGLVSAGAVKFFISQACCQFACHTSGFNIKNPTTISPNKESNLVTVKVVCINLPPCMPRELI